MAPPNLIRAFFPRAIDATTATTTTTAAAAAAAAASTSTTTPTRTRARAAAAAIVACPSSARTCADPRLCLRHCRCFAQVSDIEQGTRDISFTSAAPRYISSDPQGPRKGPDARKLQLGETVRELHERLPALLKEPLPAHILSPAITLHLFPSTHPHLPTVSGRIAYVAALWTAPVAWGRMPLIGNVKLDILSERMVRNGTGPGQHEDRDEKLIVKWKTCGKTRFRDGTGGIYRGMGLAAKDPVDKIKHFIGGTKEGKNHGLPQEDPQEFCGIFIFEFDDQGRILKHTIEHTEEGGHWDRMTRMVSVTDWLLGHFNGKRKAEEPSFALCEGRPNCGSIQPIDRRERR